jgi:hypothetical protein
MYRCEIDKVQRDRCYHCDGTGTEGGKQIRHPDVEAGATLAEAADNWEAAGFLSVATAIRGFLPNSALSEPKSNNPKKPLAIRPKKWQ